MPLGWQTDNFELLVTTARTFLRNIVSNRTRNRQQRTGTPAATLPPKQTKQKSMSTPTTKLPTAPPKHATTSTPLLGSPEETREPWQVQIHQEIGKGSHTAARVAHWQSLAGNDKCYYHRLSTHLSSSCFSMNRAIQQANKRLGTQTDPPTVTSRQVVIDSTTLPHTIEDLQVIMDDIDVPTARSLEVPYIDDSQWDMEELDNIAMSIPLANFTSSSDTHTTSNNNNDSVDDYSYFIIDSGADAHMCNNRELFTSTTHDPHIPFVRLGDGSTLQKCEGVLLLLL